MKVGLEFEGVIVNYSTGEITRWSKIDEATRARIKKLIYIGRKREEPCDGYDALAEVRTEPLLNPTPEVLIEALFTQMELASNAFAANGFEIRWFEQKMPENLHKEIQADLNNPLTKVKKFTQTFTSNGIEGYSSVGNIYRGGGLHINVSPVDFIFAPSLVWRLHTATAHYRNHCKFQSHYRNNILFRQRYSGNDPLVEYMTHGFNVLSLKDWRKDLEIVKKFQWFNCGIDMNHILWAYNVLSEISTFFQALKK